MGQPKDFKFIPISSPSIGELELKYVTDALRSGWVSSIGPYLTRFEDEFARSTGTREAIAVSNGTVGLHLALAARGIGPGDEVIVPDLTFVATANSVQYCGASVVFCDVDPKTFCIDPVSIKEKLSPRTKAIIPVHLYGHPAAMDEIMRIAQEYGLYVVEDAAEAQGAKFRGNVVGGLGHCAVFSFYGNKLMTTGEGGMITTNDQKLAGRLRTLRDHAMSKTKRYWHEEVGYNYRMTNLQAALGLAQLERTEHFITRKREIFERYRKLLGGIRSVELNYTVEHCYSSYWMVCVTVRNLRAESRDLIMAELKLRGVDSRPYFYPLTMMPMYKQQTNEVALRVHETGFNIPSYVDITDADQEFVVRNLIEVLAEYKCLS